MSVAEIAEIVALVGGMFVLFLAGLIALLPVRTKRLGYCFKCEYDLTGNISGTCPECGSSIDASERRRNRAMSIRSRAVQLCGVLMIVAVAVHVSFVAWNIRHVLNPSQSPYGHENAFGDAGPGFWIWCVGIPGTLSVLAAICLLVGIVVAQGWRIGIPLRWWTALAVNLVLQIYVAFAYGSWFFD